METLAKQLVEYIHSLPDFQIYNQADGAYGHIGATLADAVLQANNNYKQNVRPRITRIRERYGNEQTREALELLLQRIGVQEFLNWNGTRKPQTFIELVHLLRRESVNTEADLTDWLQLDDSCAKLLAIRFIGPKTADYLKNLVGLSNVAMDRHLFDFLERAGFGRLKYVDGKEVILRAADLLALSAELLDHSIWRYMSGDNTPVAPCDEKIKMVNEETARLRQRTEQRAVAPCDEMITTAKDRSETTRLRQRTEQRAVDLVMPKLQSRGYEVTDKNKERRNNQYYDLECRKDNHIFYVDVKGWLGNGTGVFIKDRRWDANVPPNLFYICVRFCDPQPEQYFIVSHDQVNTVYDDWARTHTTKPNCLSPKELKDFEDCWNGLCPS